MSRQITDGETIIGMPPGIGDLHWIMTIMESFKKRNNINKLRVKMNLNLHDEMHKHDCSLEYLALVPFVDYAESITEVLPFEYQILGGSGTSLFKNYGGCDYMIEFNSSLERGVKLKDILPEYEANFDYPIIRPSASEAFAEGIKKSVGGKLILLLTSSIGGNNAWAKEYWVANDWMELARKIYEKTDCKPVLIGARYDKAYARRINELDINNILYDLIDKTSVAHLFALIRAADALVSFQCGVVMMATKFKTPVVGFWPIKSPANPQGILNRPCMRSWIPPWAEKVGFMPLGFGDKDATPDGVYAKIERYL